MAEYNGIHPMSGTIGGVTYVKGKNGKTYVRKARGPVPQSKKQMQGADNMVVAGPLASRIRAGWAPFKQSECNEAWVRLMKCVWKGIHAAAEKGDGSRFDAGELKGFQLNRHQRLGNAFWGHYAVNVDEGGMGARIVVPAFDPEHLRAPEGHVTHYRFVAGAVGLHSGKAAFEKANACSDWMPMSSGQGTELEVMLKESPGENLMLLFGVEYSMFVNGHCHPFHSQNAVDVVEVMPCNVENVRNVENVMGSGASVAFPLPVLPASGVVPEGEKVEVTAAISTPSFVSLIERLFGESAIGVEQKPIDAQSRPSYEPAITEPVIAAERDVAEVETVRDADMASLRLPVDRSAVPDIRQLLQPGRSGRWRSVSGRPSRAQQAGKGRDIRTGERQEQVPGGSPGCLNNRIAEERKVAGDVGSALTPPAKVRR